MESILKTLTLTPAPSGNESSVRDKIISLLGTDDYTIDTHGTLIVHKSGAGDGTVILCAMDTPCLYVTYPEEGFARFSAVGGLKPSVGMQVLCENNILGVIGSDEKGFFIDTGSLSLSVGHWAVPLPTFHPIDEEHFSGASIGQYATVAAMISAAKTPSEKEAYFVFATKSHIRQLSPSFMKSVKASRLISVEVSSANDAPAEKTVFAALSKGTTIRVKDEAMLSSPLLTEVLSSVPYKTYKEVSTLRGVGGSVQKAYGGIEAAGIGIPVRYKGSANEIVSISDIQNTANIISYILK